MSDTATLRRTNEIFMDGFANMVMLLRYLYMDPSSRIKVQDEFDHDIILTMDDDGTVMARNEAFDITTNYTGNITVETCLDIKDQLEQQPPVMKNTAFRNRYEEIKFEVRTAVALNKQNTTKTIQDREGNICRR